MIADALRYPVEEPGRPALLRTAGAVVAVAIGVRYAWVFVPSVIALVPAAIAAVSLVVLLGTLSRVLVADATRAPSLRSSLRPGVVALVLSVGFLAPPVAVLLLATTGGAGTTADGIGTGSGLAFLVASTASAFLLLACAYALPAAIASSVRTGRPRAGVDVATLAPALADADYLLRWTIGFCLLVLAGGLVLVTVRSGEIAGLLAATVAAYLLLAGAQAVGTGYDRAVGARRPSE